MNLFMMGARNPTGRNPKPRIHRFGLADRAHLRGQRHIDFFTVDRSRQYPKSHIHADRAFMDLHVRVAQTTNVSVGRWCKGKAGDAGDVAGAREVESVSQIGAVNQQWIDAVHVAIPVDVAQVGQIDRIFSCLLRVAGQTDGPSREIATAGLVGLIGR